MDSNMLSIYGLPYATAVSLVFIHSLLWALLYGRDSTMEIPSLYICW